MNLYISWGISPLCLGRLTSVPRHWRQLAPRPFRWRLLTFGMAATDGPALGNFMDSGSPTIQLTLQVVDEFPE